jgi:hypothetical protein
MWQEREERGGLLFQDLHVCAHQLRAAADLQITDLYQKEKN